MTRGKQLPRTVRVLKRIEGGGKSHDKGIVARDGKDRGPRLGKCGGGNLATDRPYCLLVITAERIGPGPKYNRCE